MHPFFNGVDFFRLEQRKLNAVPFCPAMKDSLDMSNFDAYEQRPVAPPPESDDAQADDELFSDWVYADTS